MIGPGGEIILPNYSVTVDLVNIFASSEAQDQASKRTILFRELAQIKDYTNITIQSKTYLFIIDGYLWFLHHNDYLRQFKEKYRANGQTSCAVIQSPLFLHVAFGYRRSLSA